MSEAVDRLRALNQSVNYPLELPGEDDLVRVEEELLLPLPAEMRRFLLEVSDLILGRLEPVTAADPLLHTYLPEVAALAWDLGLPRDMLPLCQYADGYYCVSPSGEVFYWNGEDYEGEPWSTVWQWAEEIWAGECHGGAVR